SERLALRLADARRHFPLSPRAGDELAALDELARVTLLLREALARPGAGHARPHLGNVLALEQRHHLAVQELAPTPGFESSIAQRPDAHAPQVGDLVSDAREHAANLAVHAFVHGHRELRRIVRAPIDEDAR